MNQEPHHHNTHCTGRPGDLLAPGVETDGQGLPTAFRVLGYGPGTVTQHGRTRAFHLHPEHARSILDHARQKDVPLPVDCEHAVFHLAEALGSDESAVANRPLLGERAACGFVRLEGRADGIWARVERWAPRAAWLLREKMYRYFSPVIRGLETGRLRITSLALTNSPAIDGMSPLVAAAEPQGETMSAMLDKLAALLGVDQVALDADGQAAADLAAAIDRLHGELQALRSRRDQAANLEGEVAALRAERDAHEKRRLLDEGLATGRLTPALIESWAGEQDAATLAAFLEHAPPIVPPGHLDRPVDGPAAGAALAAVTAACGQDLARVSHVHNRRQRR